MLVCPQKDPERVFCLSRPQQDSKVFCEGRLRNGVKFVESAQLQQKWGKRRSLACHYSYVNRLLMLCLPTHTECIWSVSPSFLWSFFLLMFLLCQPFCVNPSKHLFTAPALFTRPCFVQGPIVNIGIDSVYLTFVQ